MGSFYSPYVNHCIRFYVKYPAATRFKTEVDRHNWKSVSFTLNGLSNNEINAILEIYSGSGKLEENVRKYAKKVGIKKDALWKSICEFEKRVAINRGLV